MQWLPVAHEHAYIKVAQWDTKQFLRPQGRRYWTGQVPLSIICGKRCFSCCMSAAARKAANLRAAPYMASGFGAMKPVQFIASHIAAH
jgi:hypothetical protein